MRIAFVNQPWTPAIPPQGSDSTGIWTEQICRHLKQDALVFFYGLKTNNIANSTCYNGIYYCGVSPIPDKLFKVPRLLEKKFKLNSHLPYFASTLFAFGYILQIALEIRKRKFDIVHIHNFSQFVPIVRAFNPKTKIVLHLHCEWLSDLDRATVAKRIDKADLILGCSNHIVNQIRDRFPEYRAKCQTVYNGVDTNHFVPSPKSQTAKDIKSSAPTLLFVGRISPEKGVHLSIDAFLKVVKKYPQAKLKLVGPEIVVAKELLLDFSDDPEVKALEPFYTGSYQEHLQQRIPNRWRSSIEFIGGLTQEELLPHYWNADILINPSFSEALGMSLIEAMATGLPVIATRVGGMVETVEPGTTGLLVTRDAEALADAITELLENESLRTAMGQAGRQRVLARFSWQQIAASLVACYQKLGVKDSKDSQFLSNTTTAPTT